MSGGAPRGNRNALKHGLYSQRTVGPARLGGEGLNEEETAEVRKATFAIRHLEQVIDAIQKRMLEAEGEAFTRLANSLSLATTALFNGHRTVAYLTGGATPMEEAIRELERLKFSED